MTTSTTGDPIAFNTPEPRRHRPEHGMHCHCPDCLNERLKNAQAIPDTSRHNSGDEAKARHEADQRFERILAETRASLASTDPIMPPPPAHPWHGLDGNISAAKAAASVMSLILGCGGSGSTAAACAHLIAKDLEERGMP